MGLKYAFLIVTILFMSKGDVSANIIVTNAVRSIDMTSQLVRVNTKITCKNEGESPVATVNVAQPDSVADKLAFISAVIVVEDDDDTKLDVKKIDSQDGHALFSVELDTPLGAGASKPLMLSLCMLMLSDHFLQQLHNQRSSWLFSPNLITSYHPML